MEQILVRGLPAGTKDALTNMAFEHGRSMEAELRHIIAMAIKADQPRLPALLQMNESINIDFEPDRVPASLRPVEF